MWGAWKSHGLLLLAAGVLVASGAYAPWLVGATGEGGWFRWCIEWIPYTFFATVGLDFDGVRVAAATTVSHRQRWAHDNRDGLRRVFYFRVPLLHHIGV